MARRAVAHFVHHCLDVCIFVEQHLADQVLKGQLRFAANEKAIEKGIRGAREW